MRVLTITLGVVLSILTAHASLAADRVTLRLALLPIIDTLPVYIAQSKGYFDEHGIEVNILPVGSAVERNQLMQAGRADGMINEISGAALFNRDQNRVKIVAIARSPRGESPLFRVLALPGNEIRGPVDLAGREIGVSKNTIIEYVTQRLLVEAGVASEDIRYRSVPVLPERLQLLLAGKIEAVTLPDPLAASGMAAGAIDVVNDLELPEASASVITFSTQTITAHPEAVRGFLAAWDQAIGVLNESPDSYRELMLSTIRVPPNVRDSLLIPEFPSKSLPNSEQWDNVMAWLVEKGLLDEPLAYEDSVTGAFLPPSQ